MYFYLHHQHPSLDTAKNFMTCFSEFQHQIYLPNLPSTPNCSVCIAKTLNLLPLLDLSSPIWKICKLQYSRFKLVLRYDHNYTFGCTYCTLKLGEVLLYFSSSPWFDVSFPDYLRKIIVQGRSSKSTKVGDIMTEEVCFVPFLIE